MRSTTIRALAAAFVFGAAAVPAVGILASVPAYAETIKTPAVAKLMKEAQAAARSGDYRTALAKAQQARGSAVGGEAVLVTKYIAYAATQAGAYGTALEAYDRLIASGAVSRTEGMRTAMLLAIKAGMNARAAQYANQLGGAADPLLVAQIQFKAGNCAAVIRLLQGALNSAQPQRGALMYLQSCYYRQKNDAMGQRVLELLATHYPSPDTWSQILSLAQRERGLPSRGLLEVYRLRIQVNDLKTHDEFTDAAKVELQFRCSQRGKAILDKAVTAKLLTGGTDQRLINVVVQHVAQSPAEMAKLRQEAAANPADGSAEIALAEMLWCAGQLPQAEQAARAGIKQGNLRDADSAQFVLGHILFSQGKRGEAAQAFGAVKTGKVAGIARLWSLYARRG